MGRRLDRFGQMRGVNVNTLLSDSDCACKQQLVHRFTSELDVSDVTYISFCILANPAKNVNTKEPNPMI